MKDSLLQYIRPILGFSIIIFMGWYFMDVLAYILIATFISMMGAPLVKKLDNIEIKKWKMPHTMSAVLALIVIILVFSAFMVLIVPLIIRQANIISNININDIIAHYQEPMELGSNTCWQ